MKHKAAEILSKAYASASALGDAFAIERDPAKQQVYGLAFRMKLARAKPYQRRFQNAITE
jgi:hypothetical protein